MGGIENLKNRKLAGFKDENIGILAWPEAENQNLRLFFINFLVGCACLVVYLKVFFSLCRCALCRHVKLSEVFAL